LDTRIRQAKDLRQTVNGLSQVVYGNSTLIATASGPISRGLSPTARTEPASRYVMQQHVSIVTTHVARKFPIQHSLPYLKLGALRQKLTRIKKGNF
jgi:hypothetical protein